jgi:DNA-binding MarR family transcriptional regulator
MTATANAPEQRQKRKSACDRLAERNRTQVEGATVKAPSGRFVSADQLWGALNGCTAQLKADSSEALYGLPNNNDALFLSQLGSVPNGLTITELAARLSVTGGSITSVVSGLEGKGLVVRAGDPRDRRICTVRLTASGHFRFSKMARAYQKCIW